MKESAYRSPPGHGRGHELTPCTYHFFTNIIHFSAVKMKAADSTETMVTVRQTTRHHIAENNYQHDHSSENIKSYGTSHFSKIHSNIIVRSYLRVGFAIVDFS
jgi:hypothetical protein